jgi:hypothetical protein
MNRLVACLVVVVVVARVDCQANFIGNLTGAAVKNFGYDEIKARSIDLISKVT